MVAGYLPFEDSDTNQLYAKILSGQFQMPKTISSDCADLLTKIMNTDPDKRYTTEQIKQHPWYLLHKPVCRNQGLIIGKNEIPIENSMLSHLEKFGFKRDYATTCLNKNKHNQVTTVYYLLHKRFEMEGKLPSSFKVETTPVKKNKKRSKSKNRKEKTGGVEKKAQKPTVAAADTKKAAKDS
jgi:5'-AMP-activated protein kinase, catalytic alpha subunit